MGKFFVIKDLNHICIGKEGHIKSIDDHRPLLFKPEELDFFVKKIWEGFKSETFQTKIKREIGDLIITRTGDKWTFHGNRGSYLARTYEIKELLGDLVKPGITIKQKNKLPLPVVVSAPHGGFDKKSDWIAVRIGRKLKTGLVIATHFRYPPVYDRPDLMPMYINVNRPTEGKYVNDRLKKEIVTSRAGQVYFEYQTALLKAGRVSHPPLEWLIEIHSHKRDDTLQIALTGELNSRKLKTELLNENNRHHQVFDPGDILIEGTDKIFWKASLAKRYGAFRKEVTRFGIHIEIPYKMILEKKLVKTASCLTGWLDTLINKH